MRTLEWPPSPIVEDIVDVADASDQVGSAQSGTA
jgi:hypothetical protein